mmetsp:Transcript_37305/g.62782  ORF Transcript_37305/g.62782 Transcript_37305/m.62782 type:complete len:270 (-) Transcript_37305:707-1516(-)
MSRHSLQAACAHGITRTWLLGLKSARHTGQLSLLVSQVFWIFFHSLAAQWPASRMCMRCCMHASCSASAMRCFFTRYHSTRVRTCSCWRRSSSSMATLRAFCCFFFSAFSFRFSEFSADFSSWEDRYSASDAMRCSSASASFLSVSTSSASASFSFNTFCATSFSSRRLASNFLTSRRSASRCSPITSFSFWSASERMLSSLKNSFSISSRRASSFWRHSATKPMCGSDSTSVNVYDNSSILAHSLSVKRQLSRPLSRSFQLTSPSAVA